MNRHMGCPTFVINLQRDTERRDYMCKQLQQLGMTSEFIPAVDGRAMDTACWKTYDRAKTLRIYGVEMMATEIGCYLSHFHIYERMIREAIPVALVMEDDIVCNPNLPSIIEDLLSNPAPEWLVVRLESQRGRVVTPRKKAFLGRAVQHLRHGELTRLGTHVLGFGAYLIRKEGAQRMLEYGNPIFMPIDQTMDRYHENGIAPYIVRPLPVHQDQKIKSRIGARPPNRNKGQPLYVRLVSRVQRIKDGISKRIYALRHPLMP